MEFPEVVTPAGLAKQLGWSERRIRVLARELGACRILGNRMVLTKEDVEAVLEATRPKPLGPRPLTYLQSPRATGAQRLPNVSYQDLVAFRERDKKKKELEKKRQRAFRGNPPK